MPSTFKAEQVLVQQLVTAGEQVVDVQPKFGSRVRLLYSDRIFHGGAARPEPYASTGDGAHSSAERTPASRATNERDTCRERQDSSQLSQADSSR